MEEQMSMDIRWNNLTVTEKEMFQKSCRNLLKTTFIVRDKNEEQKKMFNFIKKNSEIMMEYFSYIGFEIVIEQEIGVAMLKNMAKEMGMVQGNHYGLKKAESIVLCCLWLIYSEKIRAGVLDSVIKINIADLQYELEKFDIRDKFNKNFMGDSLKTLKSYNLIDIHGKIGDPDCCLSLYHSLQFALDIEEFQKFVENVVQRMREEDDIE